MLALAAVTAAGPVGPLMAVEAKPQYEFGGIRVVAATADEPRLPTVTARRALEHLDEGTKAWSGARTCIACHTNGTYMQIRPSLTSHFGPPATDQRDFHVAQLATFEKMDRGALQKSTRPGQVIYLAAGLAEWDAHVTGSLSPETRAALDLMLDLQLESGTWGSLDCWPPLESDAYHEATVAAMAVGTAPGWLTTIDDDGRRSVERLKTYLRETPPPHDYGGLLLLWASTRLPDLLPSGRRAELLDMIWRHQRADGGWSIRTFAAPEAWGGGNRAAKLRAEPDCADPPSDGHQTGLAVLVLHAAGVDAAHPELQRGIAWLKVNQRESGRWWTRSLNTDSWHFITYSGTAYALAALAATGEIPPER
jgi:squalene-hopene/tetraprenyl-beta-curcumene cyclase